jgi:hypothetical protein
LLGDGVCGSGTGGGLWWYMRLKNVDISLMRFRDTSAVHC